MPLNEYKPNYLDPYASEYNQSATNEPQVSEYAKAQQARAGQIYGNRVSGTESLARAQQQMALANAQRELAGAAAAGGGALGARQAMIGSAKQQTDITGGAGYARQQEIMAARGQLVGTYGQQSQRLLALQDMENKRRMAAMQARLARERGDFAAEAAILESSGQLAGAIAQGAGAAMGAGASGFGAGGGGAGNQAGAGGQAVGSAAYGQSQGAGRAGYWSPQDYKLEDYMNTGGGQDWDPYSYAR